MSSQPPAAFAQLFGQLGQAMQNGAANARVSENGESQPFEGAFTQLFGQLGQAMQSSAANMPVGQDGSTQAFRFNSHRGFQFGVPSSPAPGSTNQQGEDTSTGQTSHDWSAPESRSGAEPSAPDFSNVLRGMATGVAHAFQNSSGLQEAMSNVATGLSTGLEQAVQNMSASPEFHEFQETMTSMAEMFGDQQPNRPSTSEDTLRSLPKVQVSNYDLKQEQNSSCSICLEQYTLGDAAIRLPCGHLFHEDCCKQWLRSANTCPVCRFELPTEDGSYDQAGGARMQTEHRRPRLRLADLSAKSPDELRHLANFLRVDYTGCIEKSDLVNRIAASGAVEIIPEPTDEHHAEEHAEERHATRSEGDAALPRDNGLSVAHLEKMTIREIKAEMSRIGIDQKGCLEKQDLIEKLIQSGNLSARPEPSGC